MRSFRTMAVFALQAFVVAACCAYAGAQGNSNNTGTGGIHEIRGRIYLPSGKTLDASIEVELQSTNYSTLKVFTDRNGGYSFRSLSPGNYAIVVPASDIFETTREYVTIDTEVQGTVRIMPSPKILTVPIYLQQKRVPVQKTGVISAKWSEVPRASVERYERGLDLAKDNRTAEAIAEFRKAIELSPSFAPAYTALGKVLLKIANLDEAVQTFRSALRYDPSDFDAHLDLGIALLNQKQLVQAEPELVTAAYMNRSAVTPHYYLGILFVMRNDLDIARKAFETAKSLKDRKSLPALHKYLGRIYMAKNLKKEAIEEFETYISLMPQAQDLEKIRKDISSLQSKYN
jgi:tetratricopeptide (TPR) repeat protein